jgi:hypothetical protein
MTLDIPFRTLHEAVKGAFGLEAGKNVYITFGSDGLWHLTDWNRKAKDSIYLCLPTLSENDPVWLESTK